ncbi:1-deoxy-D-xylulose-5-phosphate reductoisomerase [Patescibacteria group bacterium]|nr:1-deoxy-D-xylulose-5-phosphate reductoisomerase [Patescibacteria group bacterium]
MKKLIILGSTGNIGTQVLDVINKYPKKLKIVGLATNNNADLLLKQIRKYKPKAVAVANKEEAEKIRKKVSIPVYSGKNSLIKLTDMNGYDTLVNAVVSLFGIRATLNAIRKKKDIALANKETLVAAGEIVMREVKKYKVKLMPIDSEHSALFQCLNGEKRTEVQRLIITCSGGALWKKTKKELENSTVDNALNHGTWSMGKKITIDCATQMNKGFEVIEAKWLYDMPIEKINVVIHPQSVIHSMVEYSDGSIMAQMANPDMRLPIQYALSYPERWDSPIERMNFSKTLTFENPDFDRFPCLKYALEAVKKGGTLPAVMNAANDFMVWKFLDKECKFMDISKIVRQVMDTHKIIKHPTLEQIEKSIQEGTRMAEKVFSKLK